MAPKIKNRVHKNFRFSIAKKVPKTGFILCPKLVQNSTNIPKFQKYDLLCQENRQNQVERLITDKLINLKIKKPLKLGCIIDFYSEN